MADPTTSTTQLQPRRSSSQTSSSSHKSQKANSNGNGKTTTRPKQTTKRHSAVSVVSSNTAASGTPADLTSFPSLSPDSSPKELRSQSDMDGVFGQATATLTEQQRHQNEEESRRAVIRGRQAALERLTSSLSQGSGRPALFDDSFSTSEVPGALHLADTIHIEHLVEKNGAVKLVRQFARDLAVRDAEISKLRRRADARERELKRMLRDVGVSSQDIERRLYDLENPSPKIESPAEPDGIHKLVTKSSINGLMGQAMRDPVGEFDSDDTDLQATLRPHRNDSDAKSGTSSIESGTQRRQGTVRIWQDYIFGTVSDSRRTSRGSSVATDADDIDEVAGAPRITSNNTSGRRKGLDERLFQPPTSRASSPAGVKLSNAGDTSSLHSRKSSKSVSSWTVKLFAGGSQNKDAQGASSADRSRASSLGEDKLKNISKASSNLTGKNGLSAVAALKRINSYSGANGLPNASTTSAPSRLGLQRRVTGSNVPQIPNADRSNGAVATNLGPVEMDAILPMESRPPALSEYNFNYQSDGLLTDRFGFIYDQRRKKRQKEAALLRKTANRKSLTETINSHRSGDLTEEGEEEEQTGLGLTIPDQLETPISVDEVDNESSVTKRWQDYLRIATRPTELLSHTPSTAPIIGVSASDEPPKRVASTVALDKAGAPSVSPNSQPTSSTSTIVADSPEFANVAARSQTTTISVPNEQEPVKLLLEQLTELHDVLQRERTARWNEFLRKVRAERRREGEAAAAQDPERASMSLNMPEATLADGEVVGIAGLGNKGKVGRNKWREFRSLVLSGIPVAHRPKIWAECSGASAMRIPGYYDDLVNMVNVVDVDPTIVAQIDMDIHRTLTDNVFFRNGPGVAKLRDVLLAYSRRNPEVGYCQGMNLIAGSLLLTTPTAEDAFWIMTSMIENILPQHYYDHGLLASRADQQVLRQYITEVLPRLSAHLDELGVELEALTFQWFLSVFTDCLSAEALYRVWDVVLCLNVTSTTRERATPTATTTGPKKVSEDDAAAASGGGSTFLFQVALALLKLNEQQLLTTCQTPAAVYTYVNHQMTNHAISIDGLIQASEALRNVIRREDVVSRRAAALRQMKNDGYSYQSSNNSDE
ncbi:TBC domain protein, putative [Talaromyces stipitatus ATCC 10500]|uniref:TBC domain protein, putative n=1 Tax=Talaromyces stipitatus (strain ATCC 10500 / CBS 375.48 / QM 6759 / NRRL 1006) TaxID=441959 RepID=B8MES4_TALSN|nr:TBC domain protein, putative [Talaromyces stipitatus ATCC 10500]EED16957.1 TBC domain protein, putative [Talaromyces stipitatus ATCC 10500]